MSTSSPRNPVLLIHGIDDTFAVFNKMSAYLNTLGWSVHTLDLIPSNGDVGLDKLALQIRDYADRTFPANQPFDLVAFSMGGIVSRYYVQRLGGINRIQRFVTIATPHHGTLTAHFRPNIGAEQMKPGGAFLERLNQDVAMLNKISFTSIWTPLDLMIFPANSSHMPFGREVKINVAAHPWMLTDPRSMKAVAEALSVP
jgi:triacylglycerol lipase